MSPSGDFTFTLLGNHASSGNSRRGFLSTSINTSFPSEAGQHTENLVSCIQTKGRWRRLCTLFVFWCTASGSTNINHKSFARINCLSLHKWYCRSGAEGDMCASIWQRHTETEKFRLLPQLLWYYFASTIVHITSTVISVTVVHTGFLTVISSTNALRRMIAPIQKFIQLNSFRVLLLS